MNLPTIDQLPFPSFYAVADRSELGDEKKRFVHKNAQCCYHTHTSFETAILNKTYTSLVAGRVLADKLSKVSPLTLEILTGELGGAPPLPDEHPLKAAAVAATADLLTLGWDLAVYTAHGECSRAMDESLIHQKKLPPFIPTNFKVATDVTEWHAVLTGLELIYTLAGGQFTVPAGLAFHYRVPVWSGSLFDRNEFSLEVFFTGIPEDAREEQMMGLRQLFADRNQLFEELIGARIDSGIQQIVKDLTDQGLLGEEITAAAVAFDAALKAPAEATGTAANDPAPTPSAS